MSIKPSARRRGRRHRVSTVLTLRITPDLDRRLLREARQRRGTRGQLAREILERALAGRLEDPAIEARRQSRLAASRGSETEALDFIGTLADLKGWK